MVIEEAERFYKQDNKEYEIGKNKAFLSWYKEIIKDGYDSYIDIDELQGLISKITNWYETKYPEREFDYFDGIKDMDFLDIRSMSKSMNMRQLLYRLDDAELSLIECGYRARGWGQYPVRENGEEHWQVVISMGIYRILKDNPTYKERRDPYFLLRAKYPGGEVTDNAIKRRLGIEEDTNLEDLLDLLEERYTYKYDFSELKQCIYNHDCDMELRKKVLQLAALSILYSKNTTPERGYERAKRFINEFNKKLGLDLSTEQIDEIMSRDYMNGEKWVEVVKTYTKKDGTTGSYITVENVGKKKSKDKKAKELVQSLFKKNN